MNRIDKKFQELRNHCTKAFMSHVYTEDPNSEPTSNLFHALEEACVDFIEFRRRRFLGTNVF